MESECTGRDSDWHWQLGEAMMTHGQRRGLACLFHHLHHTTLFVGSSREREAEMGSDLFTHSYPDLPLLLLLQLSLNKKMNCLPFLRLPPLVSFEPWPRTFPKSLTCSSQRLTTGELVVPMSLYVPPSPSYPCSSSSYSRTPVRNLDRRCARRSSRV